MGFPSLIVTLNRDLRSIFHLSTLDYDYDHDGKIE